MTTTAELQARIAALEELAAALAYLVWNHDRGVIGGVLSTGSPHRAAIVEYLQNLQAAKAAAV